MLNRETQFKIVLNKEFFLQKTDPDFLYKVKYDEEDRVVNIFWVDGLARKSYVRRTTIAYRLTLPT